MGAADHRSMRTGAPHLSDERGYTLVELLVAAFVLVVGMAGAFALLNGANASSVTNNARMGATNLAREVLEDARSVDYDALKPRDDRRRAAGEGRRRPASPWTITRRGIKYTVDAQRLHVRRPEGQHRRDAARQRLHAAGAGPGRRRHAGPRDPARRLPPRHGQRSTGTRAAATATIKQVVADQQPVRRPGPADHQVRPADRSRRPRSPAGTTRDVPDRPRRTRGSVRWNSDGTPNGVRRLDRRPDDLGDHLAARHRPPAGQDPRRPPTGPRRSTRPATGARRHLHGHRARRSTTSASPATRAPPCCRSTARGRSRSPGFEVGRNFNRAGKRRVPLEPEPRAGHHRLPRLRPRARRHVSATATTR